MTAAVASELAPVKIVIVRNIMDPGGSREETDYPYVGGAPMRDYVPNTVKVDERLTIWRNGHLVMPSELDTIRVEPGDFLQFNVNPGFTAMGVGAAITSVGWLATAINVVGNIALSAGMSYVASLFVDTPRYPDKQVSPTYGAGGVRTQSQHGAVIPIVYGRQIVGGNTIRLTTGHGVGGHNRASGYGSSIGSATTNLVLGLCEGPVYSVGGITQDTTQYFTSGGIWGPCYGRIDSLGMNQDSQVGLHDVSGHQYLAIRQNISAALYWVRNVKVKMRRVGTIASGKKITCGLQLGGAEQGGVKVPSGQYVSKVVEMDPLDIPTSWMDVQFMFDTPAMIDNRNLEYAELWARLEAGYDYGAGYIEVALTDDPGIATYGGLYYFNGSVWTWYNYSAMAYIGLLVSPYELGSSKIKVNGNSIENFAENGFVSVRRGSLEQEALPGDGSILVERKVDQSLTPEKPVEFSTQNTVTGLGIVIAFPSGWYHQRSSGPTSGTYSIDVDWRITGTTAWLGHQSFGSTNFYTNPDFDTHYVDFPTDRNSPNAQFRDQAVDVRVTLRLPQRDLEMPIVWQSLQDYSEDQALNYPYTALLQLNTDVGTAQGAIENVTALIEGKLVHQYDGGDWATYGYSRNPAWCALDLALNSRYGGGNHLTLADADITSFEALADYCDESIPDGAGGSMPRCALDLTIDQQRSLQDWLSTIGAVARTKIYRYGNRLRCKVEQATDPTMIFTAGNTVAGSFRQRFLGKATRPNVIELKFWDEDLDYAENTATATVSGIRADGEPDIKENLDFRGCSNLIRARMAAKYYGNQVRYTNWTAEFRTFISAVSCEPGDVIGLQNDAMDPEGVGGRLYENAPGSTSIKLDQDLTIDASGDPYQITVWRELGGADTLQTATIDEAAGTYPAGTTLDITPSWVSVPQAGDVYGVRPIRNNPDNTLPTDEPGVVLARVVTWKITQDLFVDMKVAQYDERVFDDTPDDMTQPPRVETIDGNQIPPRPISMNIKMVTQGNKQHALITWKKAVWPYEYRCKLWYRQIYPGVPFERFCAIPGGEDMQGEAFYVPDMPEGTAWQVAICPKAPWTGRHHGPFSNYVTRRRIYVERAYNDQRRMQVNEIHF